MKRTILLLAVALVAGCSGRNGSYDASGTFEATEIIVSSEANGKIMRFDVEEGNLLQQGQQVGYVDTVQLYLKKLQLIRSTGAVGSRRQDISKQVAATREQISKQKYERERTLRLLDANAVNRKQLDDIDSQIAVLERQLEAQLSSLTSANMSVSGESSAMEVQVAQVEDMLAKSHITSPITGTVLVKYAERDEVTAAGRPLFKIADVDNMILRVYVTSGQLTDLRIGQKVNVMADSGDKGSREYEGTVTWIADKAEFTPKTIQTRDERANLVYAVKIAVKNDGLLKIGMYADVKF